MWNRKSVPNGTTYIVVGVDDEAKYSHPVGNAGPYSPTTQTTGMPNVEFTASSSGTIYARLIALGSAMLAEIAYKDGFSGAKDTNYVEIGSVEVP